MLFHYPNAFSINHLINQPFPFSTTIQEKNGIFALSICPLQVISVADIIQSSIKNFCIVFDVDHYWTRSSSNKLMSFVEVAKQQKIFFKPLDDETIAFDKNELLKLLKDFSHYILSAYDSPFSPEFDQVLENCLACKEHNWKSENSVLEKLKHANFYLNSHDDCYLYAESVNLDFIREVFARNLQMYVSTLFFEQHLPDDKLEKLENVEITISNLPKEIINQLFSSSQSVTILPINTQININKIDIPFSTKEFSFLNEQHYEIIGHIIYNFKLQQWNLG